MSWIIVRLFRLIFRLRGNGWNGYIITYVCAHDQKRKLKSKHKKRGRRGECDELMPQQSFPRLSNITLLCDCCLMPPVKSVFVCDRQYESAALHLIPLQVLVLCWSPLYYLWWNLSDRAIYMCLLIPPAAYTALRMRLLLLILVQHKLMIDCWQTRRFFAEVWAAITTFNIQQQHSSKKQSLDVVKYYPIVRSVVASLLAFSHASHHRIYHRAMTRIYYCWLWAANSDWTRLFLLQVTS